MAREKRQPSEGFGRRIADRLRELDYWYLDKDTPDLTRFEKATGGRLRYQYMHRYIYKGSVPADVASIIALAAWLRVAPGPLLFGAASSVVPPAPPDSSVVAPATSTGTRRLSRHTQRRQAKAG